MPAMAKLANRGSTCRLAPPSPAPQQHARACGSAPSCSAVPRTKGLAVWNTKVQPAQAASQAPPSDARRSASTSSRRPGGRFTWQRAGGWLRGCEGLAETGAMGPAAATSRREGGGHQRAGWARTRHCGSQALQVPDLGLVRGAAHRAAHGVALGLRAGRGCEGKGLSGRLASSRQTRRCARKPSRFRLRPSAHQQLGTQLGGDVAGGAGDADGGRSVADGGRAVGGRCGGVGGGDHRQRRGTAGAAARTRKAGEPRPTKGCSSLLLLQRARARRAPSHAGHARRPPNLLSADLLQKAHGGCPGV